MTPCSVPDPPYHLRASMKKEDAIQCTCTCSKMRGSNTHSVHSLQMGYNQNYHNNRNQATEAEIHSFWSTHLTLDIIISQLTYQLPKLLTSSKHGWPLLHQFLIISKQQGESSKALAVVMQHKLKQSSVRR